MPENSSKKLFQLSVNRVFVPVNLQFVPVNLVFVPVNLQAVPVNFHLLILRHFSLSGKIHDVRTT